MEGYLLGGDIISGWLDLPSPTTSTRGQVQEEEEVLEIICTDDDSNNNDNNDEGVPD